MARKKIEVIHQFRKVNVYDLILKKIINIDEAQFEILCGKGTYVRSIARDLAQKLNIQVKDINEIESGKAKHNPGLMNKINRVMK